MSGQEPLTIAVPGGVKITNESTEDKEILDSSGRVVFLLVPGESLKMPHGGLPEAMAS